MPAIMYSISPANIKKPESESDILIENIKQARYDLERAEALFNELTDEAAIDYAAYSILAARSKYVYLLGLAKKYNIKFLERDYFALLYLCFYISNSFSSLFIKALCGLQQL